MTVVSGDGWMSTNARFCALMFGAALLAGCAGSEGDGSARPARAGAAVDPARTAANVAAVNVAAIAGDREAVRAHMESMQDDFRKSIKLADPARAVDREGARQAARQIEGVRSVAWIDRENLFVIVSSNRARSYDTIDAICLALEPLGDTLGVVVSLQSGEATTGDELALLTRNCQLEPGDRALLSRARAIDAVDPEIRRQHLANRALGDQSEEQRALQEESLRALEASTPSVDE